MRSKQARCHCCGKDLGFRVAFTRHNLPPLNDCGASECAKVVAQQDEIDHAFQRQEEAERDDYRRYE